MPTASLDRRASVFLHPGDRVDDYELGEVLGEGGFGAVFRARQLWPVQREVAFKVLKPGMDTAAVITRFEVERQTLARMDHPGIARVFDAGTTPAGHPYVVMELVEGRPVTGYVAEAGLGLRARLELFREICLAVHDAHSKGVIHRDLKPANVLVEERDGRAWPKIIDFGIAKLLDGHDVSTDSEVAVTRAGQVMGTPAYMSPEQLAGRVVDTRSDVHALGVLLYEMLTGRRPFEGDDALELQRAIREVDPLRPGQVVRRGNRLRSAEGLAARPEVPLDLDWICLRCLHKQRSLRYPSAAALADDVQRLLRHEPVQAAPPGTAYRAAKFVRRHRLMVTSVVAVGLGLVLAAVGATTGMLRARDAEALAREAAAEARQAARAARVAEAQALGALARVNMADVARVLLDESLLRVATEGVGRRFGSDPVIAARLRQTLAQASLEMGLMERALAEYRLLVPLARETWGPDDPATLLVRSGEAQALSRLGQREQARLIWEEVLPEQRRLLGEEHGSTLDTLRNLGAAYLVGREQRALELLEEAERLGLQVQGADHPEVLRNRTNLALALRRTGRMDEAEAMFLATLEQQRRMLGEEHRDTLCTANDLASLWLGLGRLGEAALLFESVVAGWERTVGRDHWVTLRSTSTLAEVYVESGRLEQAEALYARCLAGLDRGPGRHHPLALKVQGGLGALRRRQGRLEEAETILVEVLARARGILQADDPDLGWFVNALGHVALDQGRLVAARELYTEALAQRHATLGADHPDSLGTLSNLAGVLVREGRLDEARQAFTELADPQLRLLGPRHPSPARTLYNLACVEALAGRPDLALERLGEAVDRGYDRPANMLADGDLASLRGRPAFEALVHRARALARGDSAR